MSKPRGSGALAASHLRNNFTLYAFHFILTECQASGQGGNRCCPILHRHLYVDRNDNRHERHVWRRPLDCNANHGNCDRGCRMWECRQSDRSHPRAVCARKDRLRYSCALKWLSTDGSSRLDRRVPRDSVSSSRRRRCRRMPRIPESGCRGYRSPRRSIRPWNRRDRRIPTVPQKESQSRDASGRVAAR